MYVCGRGGQCVVVSAREGMDRKRSVTAEGKRDRDKGERKG